MAQSYTQGRAYLRQSGCLSAPTADAEVLLDSGERLPVHATVLALHCKVVDMLLEDFQPTDSSHRCRLTIPLPDEARSSAEAFLALLYCSDIGSRGWSAPNRHDLAPAELDAARRLGDKLGCLGVVGLCDAIARGSQAKGVSGCGVLYSRRAQPPPTEDASKTQDASKTGKA